MDTGSAVTLLSEKMFKEVGKFLQPSTVQITTVDGSHMPVNGYTYLSTQLGKKHFNIKYVVASHIPYDCIFGLDFLKATGAHLILDKMILKLGKVDIPLRCTTLPARTCLIISTREYEIKAGTYVNVIGQLDEKLAGRANAPGIVNKHPKLRVNADTALSKPNQNEVQMYLFNDTDEDEMIPVGGKIGIFQPLPVRGVTTATPQFDAANLLDNQIDFNLLEKNCTHLSQVELKELKSILLRHSKLFVNKLGKCSVLEHAIDTEHHRPIRCAPRRINPIANEEIDKQINQLLDQKVIEPSVSPWASPVVLVKKKTGDWRLCIDYRKLNDITVKDAHPLPRIDDTLDALQGNYFFTSLDLHSGYWQVAMNERDKLKTAFTCPQGLFHFNTMPMGLCNAAATFQRLMQYVFRGLQWKILVIYLDDIIVFGKTYQEMILNLSTVFEQLEQAGLTLRFSKCKFGQTTLRILGHIVSSKGITPDPEKIECVKSWPVPTCIKEIQSFLGFANYYRRFVKDFASIAAPLTEATKVFVWHAAQQKAFNELKSRLITSPILSYPVAGVGTFVLDTDASDIAIGAVLSQITDQERVIAYGSKVLTSAEKSYCTTRKELLAVVTFAEKFKCYLQGTPFTIRTDHQALKYLTTLKEPTGQLARWLEKLQDFNFSIEHRPGRKHTNADALSRLCPKTYNCPKCLVAPIRKQTLTNRSDDPTIYQMVPVPRPRASLQVPMPPIEISDSSKTEPCQLPVPTAPLRKPAITTPVLDSTSQDIEPAIDDVPSVIVPPVDKWLDAQEDDNSLKTIRNILVRNCNLSKQEHDRLSAESHLWYLKRNSLMIRETDGVLVRSYKDNILICVPKKLRKSIISLMHDTVEGGHYGVQKTLDKIKLRFYWPRSRYDVEEYCRNCQICQISKPSIKRTKADIVSIGTGFPGQRLGIDIVEFPKSKSGFRYALTMIDYFTRYAEVIPICDTKATTIAKTIFAEWICRYGAPHTIHSDQGKNVDGNMVINSLCKLFDIDKTRTTPYRPQCNGATERIHRTLTTILKCFLSAQEQWDELLPACLMAYRCSINVSTQYSPFELQFGRPMTLPLDILFTAPDEVTKPVDYISTLRSQLDTILDLARQKIASAQSTSRRAYASANKTVKTKYTKGQLVWLYAPNKNLGPTGKRKLTRPWTGPYRILRRISPVNYEIRLDKRNSGGELIVHVDKLKLLQVQNLEVEEDADISE